MSCRSLIPLTLQDFGRTILPPMLHTLFLNVYNGLSGGVHLLIGEYDALYKTPISNRLIRVGRKNIVFCKNANQSQTEIQAVEARYKNCFPCLL